MRDIFGDLSPDYFVLVETKTNDEVPYSQVLSKNYEIRYRRHKYVTKGLSHQYFLK